MGQYVFLKGEKSNDKLYVVLSGKVGVVIMEKNIFQKEFQQQKELKKEEEGLVQSQMNQKAKGKKNSISNLGLPFATQSLQDFSSVSNRSGSIFFHPSTLNSLKGNPEKIREFLKSNESKPMLMSALKGRGSVLNFPRTMINIPEIMDPENESDPEENLKEAIKREGEKVKDLSPGEMFGEIALVNSSPRTASIIALEDSEFIILLKKDFDKFKKLYNRDNVEKRKYMMDHLPHLEDVVGEKLLMNFDIHFEPRRFQRGTKLLLEGMPCESLFILREGSLLLEKEASFEADPEKQVERQSASDDDESSFEENSFSGKPITKNFGISNLGEGSVIGEECLFKTVCMYSVTVVSPTCFVYEVARRFINNYPMLMVETLKERFLEKHEFRMKMFLSALKGLQDAEKKEKKVRGGQEEAIIESLKGKLQPRVKEKLTFGMMTVQAKKVMHDQCSEFFLVKDSKFREKLKDFYAKYTRKMNHMILSEGETGEKGVFQRTEADLKKHSELGAKKFFQIKSNLRPKEEKSVSKEKRVPEKSERKKEGLTSTSSLANLRKIQVRKGRKMEMSSCWSRGNLMDTTTLTHEEIETIKKEIELQREGVKNTQDFMSRRKEFGFHLEKLKPRNERQKSEVFNIFEGFEQDARTIKASKYRSFNDKNQRESSTKNIGSIHKGILKEHPEPLKHRDNLGLFKKQAMTIKSRSLVGLNGTVTVAPDSLRQHYFRSTVHSNQFKTTSFIVGKTSDQNSAANNNNISAFIRMKTIT